MNFQELFRKNYFYPFQSVIQNPISWLVLVLSTHSLSLALLFYGSFFVQFFLLALLSPFLRVYISRYTTIFWLLLISLHLFLLEISFPALIGREWLLLLSPFIPWVFYQSDKALSSVSLKKQRFKHHKGLRNLYYTKDILVRNGPFLIAFLFLVFFTGFIRETIGRGEAPFFNWPLPFEGVPMFLSPLGGILLVLLYFYLGFASQFNFNKSVS